MRKRTVALVSLAIVVALVAATILALRTRWAGERICALAAARAELATGLALSFGACRVDPLALEVAVEGVRLGPAAAPVFTADAVAVRLATIQALGGRVRLAEVRLVRPRLAVRAEARDPAARPRCPPDLLSRLEVRRVQVEDASLDVTLPAGLRVVAERLDLRASPVARPLRDLASIGRTRVEVEVGGARLEGVDDHPFTSPRVSAVAEVALDLSAAELIAAEAEVDGVRVTGRGRVRDLCDPALDLFAVASGPLRDVLALSRVERDAPAEGTVFADVRVRGPAARPDVSARVELRQARVGWFHAGDVRGELRILPDRVAVDRAEWPLPGGTVVARGEIGFARGVPLEAEVELGGADLADVLERVGVEGSWVTVELDGRGKVAGTLAPLRLAGTVSSEFRELRTYRQSWRTVSARVPPVVQVARGRIDTPVEVTAEQLAFAGARVAAGRGGADVDAVVRFSSEGGFQVRWRGELDLDALGAIAEVPCGGLAQVDATAAAAPYGNPRVVGRARVDGLRYLDVHLGNAAAELDYGPDTLLRIRGAEGVTGQARWSGEGVVDLGASPARVVSSRLQAKGPVRDLLDAVRDWLPRTRQLQGVVEGDVELSGTAAGPAGLLDGAFEARMAAGTFLGRAFDSARASGTFHRGEEARFERAELRRGSGLVRMTGRYGFAAPFPWELDLSFAGVALASADLPGGPWGGTASGTAALRGSLEHPDVRFAANGDAVTLRTLPLGTLQAAGTVKERRAIVTGSGQGLRFEAEAALEGRIPFHARADLALEDAARLLPPGAPPGLRARVEGELVAEGEVRALGDARARVRLDTLQAGHAELEVRAVRPVVVTASRGHVEVEPVTLVGANTELTVSGARAASGRLDVSAAGTLDLRLLDGLVPGMRRPHGRLAVDAHASGTLEDPVLVGGGRLEDAGFHLKGSSTVLLSELRGALAFSQNRVLFEDLSGSVNGGRASLRGEVELASFVPVRLRVEAALDEVPVAVPAWLPATLSGRVEAAGTPDATLVTGRLHVVRARYTADVDLEGSMLELRRRPAPPPRPYDKAGEWLRLDLQLAVDGDARIENDLVSGPVKGELTLTGTLAAPGLVGSLAMGEGSRARFRGNEFALTHAVLDFGDRSRIEIALDVHGESQVRDYQIFMHAFGPMSDPQLTLTSTPPLSQPDIITLLSLGFTRRDAGAGAGVSGVATAAAAQALFSASGLDEQVKRFLPRGPVVRDLSVRITSEWSELTGQVEPRAEFESWLLRDRVRLRYQAPLSGARGQRAQAELRLGGHTALQYQWDNDNPAALVTGDHGVDLKLRWEWADE